MKEVPREQFGINFVLTNLNTRLLRYLKVKVIQNTVLDLNQNLRRKSKGNRQAFDCSCHSLREHSRDKNYFLPNLTMFFAKSDHVCYIRQKIVFLNKVFP